MDSKRNGMAALPEWINENYEKRVEEEQIEKLAARLEWQMEIEKDVRLAKLITFLIIMAVIALITANEILTDKFLFQ